MRLEEFGETAAELSLLASVREVRVPLEQFLLVGNATGRGELRIVAQHLLHRHTVTAGPGRYVHRFEVLEQHVVQSIVAHRLHRRLSWEVPCLGK